MGRPIAWILLLSFFVWCGGALANQPATMTHAPCPARCVNGMAEIQQYIGNQCAVAYAVPCFPNTCDANGVTCRVTQCSSDHDCAPGASCNVTNGLCAPIAYFCRDAFTIEASNAQENSCSPYQCLAGSCKQTCSSNGECAPGYSCNAGRCVK